MRRTVTLLFTLASFGLQAEIPLPQQLETLWQQGAYAEAKTLLAPKVTKKTKDAFLLAALGRTELALGDTEAATDWLERAIKLDTTNAEYQFLYGNASCNHAQKAIMLSALAHAKRCVKAYETAHSLAPAEPKYLQALAQYYAQAPGIAGGDKAKAKTLAEQLTTINPLKGQLLQLELLLREDLAQAEAMLAQSALLQQRPEAYFLIGVEQAAKRDYQAAIRQFQLASEQQVADRDAQRSRLLALYQLGRAAVLAKTATGQGINALHSSAAASSTRRRKRAHRRERTLMGDALANFVYVFLWVYLLLLFAYILTSWIRLPYRPWLNRVQRFLYDVCDPYLRIFRRFLPPLGPLDLSPMVAIFVLLIVQNILVSLLERL